MTIETLNDLQAAFADYVGENNPPPQNDNRWSKRTRLFNRGREDFAKRTFLKTLLKRGELEVEGGTATYDLPDDFDRPNGLYYMTDPSGLILTNPYQRQVDFQISRKFDNGKYELTFSEVPQSSGHYPFWYFATPPLMTQNTDPVLIDGDAALYFALKNHFFIDGDLDLYSECRDEYENIVNEQTQILDIPPPGALMGIKNTAMARSGTTSEKRFYSGRRGRRSY